MKVAADRRRIGLADTRGVEEGHDPDPARLGDRRRRAGRRHADGARARQPQGPHLARAAGCRARGSGPARPHRRGVVARRRACRPRGQRGDPGQPHAQAPRRRPAHRDRSLVRTHPPRSVAGRPRRGGTADDRGGRPALPRASRCSPQPPPAPPSTLLGTQPALVDEDDADWVLGARHEADALRRRARHLLAEALTALEPAEGARRRCRERGGGPVRRAGRPLPDARVRGRRPGGCRPHGVRRPGRTPARGPRHDSGPRDRRPAPLGAPGGRAARPSRRPADHVERPLLVGREPELAQVERAWAGLASPGPPRLLLVEGEAGIGKTRLLDAVADLATSTGGLVLRGRCHPAERSLFLQPFVDALRPALLDAPPSTFDRPAARPRGRVGLAGARAGRRGHAEHAAARRRRPAAPSGLRRRRRRAAPAGARPARAADRRRPPGRRCRDRRPARVPRRPPRRRPGPARRRRCGPRTPTWPRGWPTGQPVVRLGALPRSAVDALAAAAGLTAHGEQVMARTAGHPLSVVEYLRALAAG